MLQRSAARSVFLRHEWFHAAWQWRRADAQLNVFCVFRGDELVGALPLVSAGRADQVAARWRCLELLTVPDTQSCDFLAISGEEARVAHVCVARLLQKPGDWDVLRLKYLRPDASALTHLTAAAAAAGRPASVSEAGRNPFLSLQADWKTFYDARSRRLKKANNLVANRLKKSGSIRIEWVDPGCTNRETIARAVDIAIDISARSWKRETGNSLDQPGPQAFLRCLSAHAAECGWLSIWLLFLDEKPVAMEYELIADGDVHALRADFDAACVESSPGSYLNRHLLEALHGRGYKHYFMGPGDNAYKFRWTDEAEPLTQLTIYGHGVRAWWLSAWERTVKPRLRGARDRLARIAAGGARPSSD